MRCTSQMAQNVQDIAAAKNVSAASDNRSDFQLCIDEIALRPRLSAAQEQEFIARLRWG
jgi:hypothetical protein